jgi:hypothetical protein
MPKPKREFYEAVERIENHIRQENPEALRPMLIAMIRMAKAKDADWRILGPAVAYIGGWFGLDSEYLNAQKGNPDE